MHWLRNQAIGIIASSLGRENSDSRLLITSEECICMLDRSGGGQDLDMQAAQGVVKLCEGEKREELPNAPQTELVGYSDDHLLLMNKD